MNAITFVQKSQARAAARKPGSLEMSFSGDNPKCNPSKPPSQANKDAARAEAIRRWPAKAALFARIKDDGRAEAALIAIAGLARASVKGAMIDDIDFLGDA